MIRSAQPREAFLRPIGEWYVVSVCFVASLGSFYAYQYLFMTQSVSIVSTICTGGLGLLYLRDALYLRKYQKNIRRLRHYEINPSHTKFSRHYVSLGKGFRWWPIHTQRLRDTGKDHNTDYIVDTPSYLKVRDFCVKNQDTPAFHHLVKLLNTNSPMNPYRPLPDIGGNPAIHGIEPDEKDFLWPNEQRIGHTGIFGATRVGKTRLAELIIDADIKAGAKKVRNAGFDGNVVLVVDPKGDGDLLKRCIISCIEAGRLDDFYMFHLGFPEQSCVYNPISDFQKITEVAGRSTSQLADGGSSAAFKEFSWRFVNVNAQAIKAIGEEASYEKLAHYISHTDELLEKYIDKIMEAEDPEWKQEVEQGEAAVSDMMASRADRSKYVIALTAYAKELLDKSNDSIIRGLISALEYDKKYYDKLVASLLPFLDKMTTGKVKELLSPMADTKGKRRLRLREAISRRAVIYVGLDALTDPVVAVAVASALLSDFASVAGEIYKHGTNFDEPTAGKSVKIPIIAHLDEFNELITGDEIIQILNKAGGAGIMAHVYTQTLKDIEAKIGSAAKASQIIGNLQNIIMMRVREVETARLLTDQLPQVEVSSVTEVGGTRDDGSLASYSTDNSDRLTTKDLPMIEPADIVSLSKGQAFMFKNGGELHKLRFPLFSKDTIELPDNIEQMVATMKKNYQTSDNWGAKLNG